MSNSSFSGKGGFAELFKANGEPGKIAQYSSSLFWILLLAGWWSLFRPYVMPSIEEIFAAFDPLINKRNLIGNWINTVLLSLKAVGISCIIAILISYSAVIPFFRPIAFAISKMRYMSMMGFMFMFMLVLREPELVRTSLLVYGIVPFLVTSMSSILLSQEKRLFRYARTLNLGEGAVVWHVLVRSLASDILDAIRQNLAIAFVMIVVVESKIREGGGLGMLLYDVETRRADYSEVFAIQILIFATAICFDFLLAYANRSLFTFAFLKKERK
ncbi:MAG: hypothetical protein AAF696_21345 [Bacteroidota bacterium]